MKFMAVCFAIAACFAGAAQATTFTVLGTDAVYGAGLTGNGLSTAPVSIAIGSAPGTVLTFSNVTGATECCSGFIGFVGPDGGVMLAGGTNITGLNGISGIIAPVQLFLAGVFVNSANLPTTGSGPAALDYTGVGAMTQALYNSLGLNQVFFVGDGLTGTGSGTTQQFFAPTGADTLLLGFVDGSGFVGAPSFYGDNPGRVSGEVSVSAIPLPAGGLLLLGGLLGLAALRRRGSA